MSAQLRQVLQAVGAHIPRYMAPPGVNREVVLAIAQQKAEPQWVTEKRLRALEYFLQTPLPNWGPSLKDLDLAKVHYFVQPNAREERSWEDVPSEIRTTFEKLGIPEAERASLGGVGAQYDSGMVYHNLKQQLAEQGVIFENMDVAVQKYPDLVQPYFMTSCVPVHDHKFAMLHGAVWSGGTFIYIPPGVKVEIPLQAYFRMNADRGGQFEHTLIIADEGSEVHYIEGCSAPKYDQAALHAGCVEIFVKKNATVRYSSIENWSKNTYNLNTKRALVEEGGTIAWLNGNMGSGTTMLYPMSILRGRGAKSDYLGIAYAGPEQRQDTGHKVAIVAPDCRATVRAKSISAGGGISTYRGQVKVAGAGKRAMVHIDCDALMLDGQSIAQTIPVNQLDATDDVRLTHEARVGRIHPDQLFYFMSRGLTEQEALRLIVGGFLDPIVRELPLEYAVELVKLIELEMESIA